MTSDGEQGGDSACWAHLVCEECGALEHEGHRADCPVPARADDDDEPEPD